MSSGAYGDDAVSDTRQLFITLDDADASLRWIIDAA
jgi:hypothetical protein